jgi:hypothetical protein
MIYKCPICKGIIKRTSQNDSEIGRFFPFCSERCKMIDLGAWLDTEYRISTNQPNENSDISTKSGKSSGG